MSINLWGWRECKSGRKLCFDKPFGRWKYGALCVRGRIWLMDLEVAFMRYKSEGRMGKSPQIKKAFFFMLGSVSVETFRRKLQRRNNRIQPCLEDHLETTQNLFTFHGLHGGWALEMLSNEKRKKFRRGNANFLHIFQVCPRAARELALIWEVFSFRFEKPNWLRGKIARTDRCTWASVNFRLHYFNGAGARWERQSFILSAGLSRVFFYNVI